MTHNPNPDIMLASYAKLGGLLGCQDANYLVQIIDSKKMLLKVDTNAYYDKFLK